MKTKDFDFNLPPELIAQYPLDKRTASKLLHYKRSSQAMQHIQFTDLVDLLNPGDLLVMNNTRVIPARLYGHKNTGGRVEFLIERLLAKQRFLAHIKASKAPKPNTLILLGDPLGEATFQMNVLEKQESLYLCELMGTVDVMGMLHRIGHIPLPPYIAREDKASDIERYQTVYAKYDGSVAAPTAGLHFDGHLLNGLQEKSIKIAYVTLHVGAATFPHAPV